MLSRTWSVAKAATFDISMCTCVLWSRAQATHFAFCNSLSTLVTWNHGRRRRLPVVWGVVVWGALGTVWVWAASSWWAVGVAFLCSYVVVWPFVISTTCCPCRLFTSQFVSILQAQACSWAFGFFDVKKKLLTANSRQTHCIPVLLVLDQYY